MERKKVSSGEKAIMALLVVTIGALFFMRTLEALRVANESSAVSRLRAVGRDWNKGIACVPGTLSSHGYEVTVTCGEDRNVVQAVPTRPEGWFASGNRSFATDSAIFNLESQEVLAIEGQVAPLSAEAPGVEVLKLVRKR